MKLFKTVLFCLLLLAAGHSSPAQLLRGKITAESGRGASAITLKFSNGENSIKTNVDGSFEILAKKLPDTLTLSGVGFEPYKVVITEKDLKDPDFEVVLLNKRKRLDDETRDYYAKSARSSEPVVMGYGTAGGSGDVRLRKSESYASVRSGSTILNNRKLGFQDTTIFDKLGPYANILTAGEVNDFNKWTMWEDFTKDEFAAHSKKWGMNPGERYSVQLQNSDHSPAVGEVVKLVAENGTVIWTAVTDNTGKAELWGDIRGAGSQYKARIVYSNEQTLNKPLLFSEGLNTLTVKKACGISDKVDIAFVVDATGSMGDEIEFLKLELEDVVRKTFEEYANLDLHIGSVFYRDQNDEYLARKVDFQSDLLKLLNFVKLQRAGGGGDYPEAVHTALEMALDSMEWRADARTRIMFLFLDAPPHEEQKEEIRRLIQKAAAMGIRIVPLACSGTDKSTEYILRSMALATNGTYLFLTDNSGAGLPHIKPTTDTYNVELLNSLLQRVIRQMIAVNSCAQVNREQPLFNKPENIEQVKIYPNPTQGNITIETKKELKEIFIADFSGKILQRIQVKEKQLKINVQLGAFANGTYLVKYITKDNVWGAEKIILIH